MPALDQIHYAVKNALIKDGWTVTHEQYTLKYEGVEVHVDLAAERTIAAERAGEKIAVEVKSFIGRSLMRDVEIAVGQYDVYLQRA